MPKHGKRSKKGYSKNDLETALENINKAGMSIRQASKLFCIPRGTIQNRVHNRTKKSVNCSGPPPVLSEKEESEIVAWIRDTARKGFPRRPADVMNVVKEFLDESPRENPFTDNMPGRTWYSAFRRRHPNIRLREPEAVSDASSNVSESDIRGWFRQIENYLKENELSDILQDPTRIYNADETGFNLCPKTGKVLAPKGMQNVYEIDQGKSKESVTVLMTFSAAGDVMTPLIVYPYKRIPNDIRESVPHGFAIDKSETGWMVSEVFYDFIKNTFHSDLVKRNVQFPVILYVDGHKTHLALKLSHLCTKLRIVLICLYPNATRIQQPADVSVFKPAKTGWKDAVTIWKRKNIDKILTKVRFARILEIVVNNYITKDMIINGFRTCGLYPFNSDAIDYSKCLGGNSKAFTTSSCVTDDAISMIVDETKNECLSAIDFQRFGEIVGDQKLESLRLFDCKTDQATSDFVLLHSIFKELVPPEPDFKNIGKSSQLTKIVVAHDPAETNMNDFEVAVVPINDKINNDILNDSFERSSHDLHNPSFSEVEEITDIADFESSNSIQVIDKKDVVTLKAHLSVPSTPTRKGKKKESYKRTFIIESELWKMEETIKNERRDALEKAKQTKKEQRLENKAKKIEFEENKKKEREEVKLKKAAEKEQKELEKIIMKKEKLRQKEMKKIERQTGNVKKREEKGELQANVYH